MINKLIKFFFIGLVLVAAAGCSVAKDEYAGTGEFEYMVFGHFYGECAGEGCVEIFRLDGEGLYEDSTDVYPNALSPYNGKYYSLPEEKFELVKDLIYEFPQELYAEPQIIIGVPDGGDWGGVYVEMKYKNEPGLTGFWLLDQNEANMPQVYNEFVDKINDKIVLIHQ